MKKLMAIGLATSIMFSCFASFKNITIDALTLDSNPLQNRTMFEVKNAYLSSLGTFDYSQSVYSTEPSSSYPYVAGSLKDAVINDTLNQLNYYRWQSGLNNVGINSQYLTQNQWGAVALCSNNVLTHSPAQPAGMDDAIYKLALAGTGAGENYSGNCAAGYSIQNSIKGYIDDVNVPSMGHRYSLLDKDAFATSFGSCGIYSTLSMFVNFSNSTIANNYYSWPSPGYTPIETISASADWSITLSKQYSLTDNTAITLTADNGSSYTVNLSNIRYYDYYHSLSYTLPEELKEYLSEGTNLFQGGKSVKVAVSGLKDDSGQDIDFSYTTKFFVAKTILPTTLDIWQNMGDYFQSVFSGVNLDVNDTIPMFVRISPADATDTRYTVTSSNPIVATWDYQNSTIQGLSGGSAVLTFTSVANPELSVTCKVTVNGPSASVTSISSGYYKINTSNNTINGIYTNTSIERFLSYINERANIQILRNGNQISGSQFVGTGDQVQLVYNNNVLQTLYAVVKNDLNGDGILSSQDIVILNNSLLGKENLNQLTASAGDIDGDGKITVFDSLSLKMNKLSQ